MEALSGVESVVATVITTFPFLCPLSTYLWERGAKVNLQGLVGLLPSYRYAPASAEAAA
jgi:hypothetical protein